VRDLLLARALKIVVFQGSGGYHYGMDEIEEPESASIIGPGLGPEGPSVTPEDEFFFSDVGPVEGLQPASSVGPDIGVDTSVSVTPIDQSMLPPIVGQAQTVPPANPDAPGPDFGVFVFQGFPPDTTPEPPTLGPTGPNNPPFIL